LNPVPGMTREPGLEDLFRYLRHHRTLIGVSLISGLLFAAILHLTMPKVYEARAKFTIDQLPFEVDAGTVDAETQRQMVQSLILGLSTERMQKAVAAKLQVFPEVLAFREFEKPLSLHSSERRANIRISPIRNTRLGLITVQSQDPQFAVQVADTILEESKILNIVGVQLAEQRQSRKVHQTQLEVLNQKAAELRVENTRLQEQVQQLDTYEAEKRPLEYFPVFETDATLNNLKTQRMLVESEYQRIASQSTRGSRLEGKAAEVEGLKKQMANHAKNLEISLRAKAASTAGSLGQLEKQVGETELQVRAEDRKAAQIMEMLAHPEKASQLSTAMALPAASSNVLVVLDPGHVSRQPVRPIWWVSLSGGAILGLTIGLTWPIVKRAAATRLTRRSQVRDFLHLPFLGYLPQETSWGQTGVLARADKLAVPSVEAEKLLDEVARFAQESPPPLVLAFVPCGPEDTATYVVVDLGLQLAEAGHRALLVDLNLNGQHLDKILGLDTSCPLHSWLTHELEGPLDNIVTYTPDKKIGILPACGKPEEIRSAVPHRSLSHAIHEDMKLREFVLVDSNPVLGSREFILGMPGIRQAVLVAEYGKTRISHARRTAEMVKEAGWRIRGLVLRNTPARVLQRIRKSD